MMNTTTVGDELLSQGCGSFSLTSDQVAVLFPFFLVFDRSLRLLHAAASIRQACPELVYGSSIAAIFEMERPQISFDFEAIADDPDSLFLLRHRGSPLHLCGRMVGMGADSIAYLATPARPGTGVNNGDETGARLLAMESDLGSHDDWQLRSLAYSVTRTLAESTDSEDALIEVLKTICEKLGYLFGACWRVDRNRDQLVCQSCWAAGALRGSPFEAETLSRRLQRGVGLPGTVWDLGQPHWVPNLASEIHFPRSPAAVDSGLVSGFAVPVRLSGDSGCVLEFFSERSEEPSLDLLATITSLGSQLEQFLERREAEQQRSEVLSLLDSTLESSPEGILVVDANGRPVRANCQWMDLWAIPAALRQSFDSDALLEFIDPQLDDPEARMAVRRRLTDRPGETSVDIVRLKDGRVFDVLSTPQILAGRTVGRVLMYRDITESHRAERERERLLATLNATLEATTDGILVIDLEQRIVTVNRRFREMWRIPAELPLDGHWSNLRESALSQLADPATFLRDFLWLTEHPEEHGFDVVHFLDGRVFERSSHPQHLDGQIIGRVLSYGDVTDRWRADQALRESEERFRLVMQSAIDAIITIDSRGKIVFASESAAKVFGFASGKLAGTSAWRLLPPEFRSGKWVRTFVRNSRRRKWQAVEMTALRQDGSRLPVEISLHRSRVGGKRFLTGMLRDVSQRKFADYLLKKAIQDAESANRAKSDFLANISHEIRTPLNSIVGLTELLIGTSLDRDQREMLTTIWTSSESLLHLINDLLDFSKIEAGQVDIDSVAFDPVALGEQVIEILRLRATSKGLAFYFVVHPPEVPPLMGDANRIRQILINLIGNALKFTERGSITLRLEWHAVKQAAIGLCFTVEDTGIGIPADAQHRIFQKFFRVDTPVGRRAGGAGLGLSISSLLCQAMGGTISLASTEGEGSQFAFRLTLDRATVSEGAAAPEVRHALLLAPEILLQRELEVLTSAGLKVSGQSDLAAIPESGLPFQASDVLIVDEDLAATPEELRKALLAVTHGKARRLLRLTRSAPAQRAALLLPGRCEDLEFPLTPTRVARAIALLYADPSPAEFRGTGKAAEVVAPVQPATVLLVEDNPDSQTYGRRVLEGAGHRVVTAGLGVDAVNAAHDQVFDVILMDVMLPDMTGFEATRMVREHEKAAGRQRVPVIALTAHALQEYRSQAFSADMDDYVTKPVRPQALIEAVRQWAGLPDLTATLAAPAQQQTAIDSDAPIAIVDRNLADLVPAYLARLRSDLEQVGRHLEEGRLETVSRIGHNMRGTGTTFGFQKVSDIGEAIEEAVHKGDTSRAASLALELDDWLAKVQWSAAEE